MSKTDELRQNVESILQATQPLVQEISDLPRWDPSRGYLPIIFRAIFVRQYDSLGAICSLVERAQGFAAPAILRSSCEELIWTKYLTSIDNRDAEDLIVCIARNEMTDNLTAQDEYGGRSVTRDLGLLPHLRRVNENKERIRDRLRGLGRKLDWERIAIEHGRLPSMKWLARKTGETKLYKFIYHATSRYVHFSTGELLRHVWVGRDGASIRTVHFRSYWENFALSWGLRLFLDSTIELIGNLDTLEAQVDSDKILAAAEWIGKFGQVPIITAEELAWPAGSISS